MNVKSSNARTAGLTALSLLLTASAAAQAPAPRPDAAPKRAPTTTAAPTASAPSEAASDAEPLPKFDLAAALMAPSGGLTADDAGRRMYDDRLAHRVGFRIERLLHA